MIEISSLSPESLEASALTFLLLDALARVPATPSRKTELKLANTFKGNFLESEVCPTDVLAQWGATVLSETRREGGQRAVRASKQGENIDEQ